MLALRRTDRSSSTNTSMPPLTRKRPGRSVQNVCSYHVTPKSAPQSAANNSAAMAGSRPETSSIITVATRSHDNFFMAGSAPMVIRDNGEFLANSVKSATRRYGR